MSELGDREIKERCKGKDNLFKGTRSDFVRDDFDILIGLSLILFCW